MTVTLPVNQDLQYPLVRILVMPQGHWTDAVQPWEILPAPGRMTPTGHRYYGFKHGYDLDSVEQVALPDVGAAVFHFDYGEVNNTSYTEDNGKAQTTARDLIGYDVRIQLAPAPTLSGNTPPAITWKTVFLGTVVAQDDDPFAGASAAGRRTYRCADLLFRTTRWMMNRHNAASNPLGSTTATTYLHSIGHPGYNYAIQGYYRRTLGNKYAGTFTPTDVWGDNPSNLTNYLAHTWTGTGYASTWTDLEVVNHALASSRLKGEPSLAMVDGGGGSNALLLLGSAKFPWTVQEGESCFSFINRVLDRKRGRGLSRLAWTETLPAGNVVPGITIYPQFKDDITVTVGNGDTIAYYGATTIGTTKAVDLVGDHRLPDNGINISQNGTATVDYLESLGEPIEVLATLSPYDGTLQKRWGASEETAFAAIDPSTAVGILQRGTDRWRPIWQRWSLPQDWDFRVKNGANGTARTINYFCKDDGTLSSQDTPFTSDTTGVGTPSPLSCRILSDMPIYEGYDYRASSIVRWDGATDQISPPRLPPLILERQTDSTYFLDATTIGTGISNDDFGILVINGNDQISGLRRYGDPTSSTVISGPGYNYLVISVGIQLSHRIRRASFNNDPDGNPYGPLNAPRKKSLYFPGAFLWLADPGAIWAFNYALADATKNGSPAFRSAGNATPGILRDDRTALASLHALAWEWYRITHRTGYWTLRDCGLLTSYTDAVSGAVAYPTVGQLVTTVAAAGTTYTMNAPITRVTYNHTNGQTVWTVDWNDLDLAQ